MKAYMEMRVKKLEIEAEMQAKKIEMEAGMHVKKLEMEADVQAKKVEVKAAKAKTKTKEVALACMMEVKIITVHLSTVSPRKRPWFEKMQREMLKLDD